MEINRYLVDIYVALWGIKAAIKKFNIKREIKYDLGRSDKYKKFFNIYKKAKNINSEINYRITGRFSWF